MNSLLVLVISQAVLGIFWAMYKRMSIKREQQSFRLKRGDLFKVYQTVCRFNELQIGENYIPVSKYEISTSSQKYLFLESLGEREIKFGCFHYSYYEVWKVVSNGKQEYIAFNIAKIYQINKLLNGPTDIKKQNSYMRDIFAKRFYKRCT